MSKVREYFEKFDDNFERLGKRVRACANAQDREGMANAVDEFADQIKEFAKLLREMNQEEFLESLWEVQ